jgi:hypothetical protein
MTFADGGLGSGSLRDAVLQFNANSGSDDDIIQLSAGTYALTLRNSGGHHETAGLTGDLNLTRASHHWIIQGAGSGGTNPTIIDAGQLQDRVFEIVTPGTQVVFRNLIIQGGLAQDDGSDGALAGTTDALGGGILNNGGNVTLDSVVVQNNMARGGGVAYWGVAGHSACGGGLYSIGGALTIAGATIANNQAIGGRGGDATYYAGASVGGSACGGGLYSPDGSITISSSTLANNQAIGGRGGDYYYAYYHWNPGSDGGSAGGGGLYASGGTLDISGSRIASNRATGGQGGDGYYPAYGPSGSAYTVGAGSGGAGQGGGLYVNGSSFTIATSTVASNQATGGTGGAFGSANAAGKGGGLYNGGTLSLTGNTLSDNYASGIPTSYFSADLGYGGGISNYGTLTVTGSNLSGNSADNGGSIYNHGTLTVSNSTLSGNTATCGGYWNGGGGIYNTGTLTVTGSTLSGNSSRAGGTVGLGGGIYNNSGTLTLTGITLSGNSADLGGGIVNDMAGMLTVSNSTLSGNSATDGGGIYNYGTLALNNSTLSGNSAGAGGGIAIDGTRPVTLTNVTFTANRANTGGGIFVYSGSARLLHNTLIAGNLRGATGTTRDDVFGALDPGGDYNLIGDGTGMTGLQNGVNGNLIGSAAAPIDALLGPLQNNGGPTLTHAPLAGSPALNAGNPNQLGVADQRGVVRSGGVNIGAYQASATAFVLTAPATATAGVPFDVTVKAVDTFGQTAIGYSGTVTFSTSDTNPSDVLPASYPFTAADAGIHTFPRMTTLVMANSQTLAAADMPASITGSFAITVIPGAADHQLFLQGPTDTAAGQTITPAVTMAVVDQFGNVLTDDNSDTVTLTIGTNPGGGTLSGTLTVTVVNGVAMFSDLSIDQIGDGYTLHATVAGLTDADSAAFSITA